MTARVVIGYFLFYYTEDVCETVRTLPGYFDDGSRSWQTPRTEMLGAFRAFGGGAFKYTRGNLERPCRAFRDCERDCLVRPRELKSFLRSYHHISEKAAASGMMGEYERTVILVRTLPTRMRTEAVGELSLDPLQSTTFRYAALHSGIVARIAADC